MSSINQNCNDVNCKSEMLFIRKGVFLYLYEPQSSKNKILDYQVR